MSVLVVRWDTGREAEIPEEALRWGPDTKLGTCRAALLRPSAFARPRYLSIEEMSGGPQPVPYVLPFEGAKWAVRVTLLAGSAAPGSPAARLRLRDEAFIGHAFTSAREGREKLGSLLEAAGGALRAEEEQDRPDALGEALELLAEAIDPNVYSFEECHAFTARVRALLGRETSAEIRREWKGAGRG